MAEVSSIDQIYNKFIENKLSHAFLIETNNTEKCIIELFNLIKKINCEDEYSDDCTKCNICNLIDSNTLPSLQIIEPEGINIKKEQILDLKNKFKYEPIYSRKNIYIIKNAERLNESSANTMLKFLEEPNPNIIGFFLTSSRDNVISTIKSRCQIYNCDFEKSFEIKNYKEIENIIYNYIIKIESSTSDALIFNKEISTSELINKENLKDLFIVIFEKYRDALSKFLDTNNEGNRFDFLIETNNIEDIISKMKIIETTISKLVYNINIELLLDKFVIEMRKI